MCFTAIVHSKQSYSIPHILVTPARLHILYSMTVPTDENLSSAVHRVAVRLPPFWPERPAIWFAQAEAQFELAVITRQRTKFNHVVSQLNQQQAPKVKDIIT